MTQVLLALAMHIKARMFQKAELSTTHLHLCGQLWLVEQVREESFEKAEEYVSIYYIARVTSHQSTVSILLIILNQVTSHHNHHLIPSQHSTVQYSTPHISHPRPFASTSHPHHITLHHITLQCHHITLPYIAVIATQHNTIMPPFHAQEIETRCEMSEWNKMERAMS
jgi:hypothetical protein